MQDRDVTLEKYIADLGEALKDLDFQKFKAHCEKYKAVLPPIPSDKILEISMYKAAVIRKDMPQTQRKAEKWLKEHGYSTSIE